MAIPAWIISGVSIGAAARWVMPGPRAGGLAVAIPLGVAGAVLGGIVGVWLTGTVTNFDFRSLLLALIGALLIPFSYRSHAIRAAV